MLKSIVISILRVNWLFGSNSSYHIKHRTQQYMFNNIDQSKWIKNCSQKHQLVCQSTFYFILALTWCDHVGQSNLQLKLFEKKQRYTHTHARTHTVFLNDNTSLYEFVSSNKHFAHHLAVLKLTGFFLFCWGVDLWPEAVEEQGAGLVRSGTVDMDSNADVQWSSSSRQVSVTKIIQPMLQFLL